VSFVIALLPVTLTACVSPAIVPFLNAKGAYQTIEGTSNDGRRYRGAAWVAFDGGPGRYCARVSGKFSCSGTYDEKSQALVLEGDVSCTGRVTGRYRTEQRIDRELNSLVGVRGTARLSDGTRVTYTFGLLTPWNGENLCT
jgi:hypothetical protein